MSHEDSDKLEPPVEVSGGPVGRLLEQVARAPDVRAPDADVPPPGTRIADRFFVTGELGRGGMGSVLLARDLELGREVAIKLLRRSVTSDGSPTLGTSASSDEARATAHLNHPGIVTVHDTGEWNGAPYLVLERLRGPSLAKRLRDGPMRWPQAVDLALQIAEALAYAHARGILHLDLTPRNVIVQPGGRAKVLDFGLARFSEEVAGAREHVVAGTPLYMAPEQWLGEAASSRSDVWALGVILFEMVAGERPFVIRDRKSTALTADAPPLPKRLPRVVAALIGRALKRDPAERIPGAAAFAAALHAILRRHRRLRLGAATGAAGTLLATGALALGLSLGPTVEPCRGSTTRLAGVWDDEHRARVATALAQAAPEARAAVTADLDGYAKRWAAYRDDICAATAVRREQSEPARDLRMACADRALRELGAVVTVLEAGGEKLRRRAPSLTASIAPLASCDDVAVLARRDTPSSPELAAKHQELEDRATAARKLAIAGRLREADAAARVVALETQALGFRVLACRALEGLGQIEYQTDPRAAPEHLLRAAEGAVATGQDLVQARALGTLMIMRATFERRFDEAHLLQRLTSALLQRAGPEGSYWRCEFGSYESQVYTAEGRHAEALAAATEGVEGCRRIPDVDPTRIAQVLGDRGIALDNLGREDEAAEHFERAAKLIRGRYGEEHHLISLYANSLGTLAFQRGEYEAAIAHFRRSLAIKEKVVGPESLTAGVARLNLGVNLRIIGRPAEALVELERAVTIIDREQGPGGAYLPPALIGYGQTLSDLGRRAEALPHLERALAIRLDLKAGPAELAKAKMALGQALWLERRDRRARELLAQADELLAEVGDAKRRDELKTWLAHHRR